MDRRTVLVAGSILLSGGLRIASAQPSGRVLRLAIIRPGSRPVAPDDPQIVGIPNALGELGFVEGRNLSIDLRFGGGDPETLRALARDLVKSGVDIIVAVAAAPILAAREATSTIPIVMFGNFDPVALGLVSNLARPGGNMTGVLIAPDGTLAGKRLELLKTAVPHATRVAMLAAPDTPSTTLQVREVANAAAALGIELSVVEVYSSNYERAFAAVAATRPNALFVGASSYFLRDRAQIIELAARYRLPAMYEWREQVVDGGFMSYNTSLQGLFRRIASYIDRISRGARPGDLPIEQPTTFELVVNLRTAQALGLAIPPGLGVQIDEVIR